MLIEAIQGPITYRWPGQEVHLVPGTPVDLPDERARRLLVKAQGKVRIVMASQNGENWLIGWREVAKMTLGITNQDIRFGPITVALAQCDRAFEQGDWMVFQQAFNAVRGAVR